MLGLKEVVPLWRISGSKSMSLITDLEKEAIGMACSIELKTLLPIRAGRNIYTENRNVNFINRKDRPHL